MKKPKDFDCVEMKRQIQERLQEEWEGLDADGIRKKIEKDLSTSDSPLARWWRSLRPSESRTRAEH